MTSVLERPTTPPPPVRRGRRVWLTAGLVLALLLVADGAWNVVGLLSHKPVHHHRTWTGPVTAIVVRDSTGGRVTIDAAPRSGVDVHADGADGLGDPSDQESLVDGVLTLHASCPIPVGVNWCKLSYHLTVPRDARLEVHTNDGGVNIQSPAGPVTVSAGDGGVNILGATSRTVRVDAGDGGVRVGFATPPSSVAVHVGDGGVTLGFPAGPTAYQVVTHRGDGGLDTGIRTDPDSPNHVLVDAGDGGVTLRYGSP